MRPPHHFPPPTMLHLHHHHTSLYGVNFNNFSTFNQIFYSANRSSHNPQDQFSDSAKRTFSNASAAIWGPSISKPLTPKRVRNCPT